MLVRIQPELSIVEARGRFFYPQCALSQWQFLKRKPRRIGGARFLQQQE